MTRAGLWPREKPRPTESKAEMRLYDALALQLPRGWYVWHSLRTRTPRGIDGEGDFVIAIPNRGLLIIEVKGGHIEVRDGRWFQNGSPLDPSPREQGERLAHALIARLAAQNARPPAFGVATCFPDESFDRGPTQDNMEGRVLGAQDLPWLSEALPALVERALPPPLPASGDWIGLLHRMWGETWTPRLSLGHRARIDEERRLPLDQSQAQLVLSLSDNETLLVEGGAGTGKTLLAREAALHFAEQGMRVALFCFTAPLARWLREAVDERVTHVTTVRGFAVQLLRKANQDVGTLDSGDRWEEATLRAALDALPALDEFVDAIVIDEAQDFSESDWAVIEELRRQRCKRLWAFLDPTQAFWTDRPVPRSLFSSSFKLKAQYRSPAAIYALAQACVQQPHAPALIREGLQQGTIAIIACPTQESVESKLVTEIDKLLGEGLRPEDIAIVSVRGLSHSDSIAKKTKLGRHALVRADHNEVGSHIIADTFLRIKGLERPAIIVTDLGHLEAKNPGIRMHIALTRALVTVRIVAVRSDLEADPLLAPLL